MKISKNSVNYQWNEAMEESSKLPDVAFAVKASYNPYEPKKK